MDIAVRYNTDSAWGIAMAFIIQLPGRVIDESAIADTHSLMDICIDGEYIPAFWVPRGVPQTLQILIDLLELEASKREALVGFEEILSFVGTRIQAMFDAGVLRVEDPVSDEDFGDILVEIDRMEGES